MDPTPGSAPRQRLEAARRLDERPVRLGAGAATLALHGLLLLLLSLSEPVTLSDAEGAAGGGPLSVTWIEEIDPVPSPPPPAAVQAPRPAPDPAPRESSRLQVVRVERADAPLATRTGDDARGASARPPASEPRSAPPARRARGLPPGFIPRQSAPVNAGHAASPSASPGRRSHGSGAEPTLDAGGFQVVYDLMGEARLREWQEAGMTEVSLPLPGVRQRMVCPLETALRRESGPCRLVEPDDPALAGIGDARTAIAMYQVYRRGELVWRGPGPYR